MVVILRHYCKRHVAGENSKHRITVHVQLYYDDSLTIRWENENKIYDYKLYRRYTENAKIHARKKKLQRNDKTKTYRNSPLAENWIRCSCLEFEYSLEKVYN